MGIAMVAKNMKIAPFSTALQRDSAVKPCTRVFHVEINRVVGEQPQEHLQNCANFKPHFDVPQGLQDKSESTLLG